MSIEKTAIFISSRFAEFAEFRQLLAKKIDACTAVDLHAVELNDNGAHTQPPSAYCINWVKRSELVVLLLGDSYGPLADGHELSHTHLEYRASQDEDSNARVLPYFIRTAETGDDGPLEAFRQEVMRNHRTSIQPRPATPEQWEALAHLIYEQVLKILWDMRPQDVGEEAEDDWNHDHPMAGIPDAELFHRQRSRPNAGSALATLLHPPSAGTVQDALRHPRALAADEQLNEAGIALQIGERGIAERHLREAVKLRPLDPMANEWLARVLLSKGSNKGAADAAALAERAARIYSKTEQALRAAASLVLAARAASFSDSEQAIAYARASIEEASWYAQTHYELARQLCMAARLPEALLSVRRAYSCFPQIIEGVLDDPAFADDRPALQALIRQLHKELDPTTAGVQASAAELWQRLQLAPGTAPDLYAGPRLSRRVYSCRESVRRQMHKLQERVGQYLYLRMLNAAADAPRSVYALEAAAISLHSQDTVEITSQASVGATIAQGQPVFHYRGANNGRGSRAWLAPVPLKVVWVCNETAVRGSKQILSWTPVAEHPTASQHLTRLTEQHQLLMRAEHEQAANAAEEKHQTIRLGWSIAGCCVAVVGAYLLRVDTIASWMGGFAALYLGGKAIKFQQRRALMQAAVQRCLHRIGAHRQLKAEEEKSLSALRQEASNQHARLLEMIAVFERQALSLLSVAMPFAALRTAREGDWAAIAPATAENYAASFGMRLEINGDPALPCQPGKLALFRVVRRDRGLIVLDRQSAWFPQLQL